MSGARLGEMAAPDDAFAFGRNWQRYVAEYLTPERERIAAESLVELLETDLAGKTFLDIGCGSGLLTVQLARNGAAHVHAIDIDETAVKNTMTNAFRNGLSDRVSASAQDLYPWVPEERYDVIVASLYQMPVDPFEQVVTHRPLDYWGRNLIDHLIEMLPQALAEDGVAYIMQLSIIGQERTAQLLEKHGFQARVVDFTFFPFNELFNEKQDQIMRVEQLSDAYHLTTGNEEVMVAYLIEVTRKGAESEGLPT
jgi:cyclopropane fatty-acyl-phospholipid synthase-like methyltransferase